MAWEKAREEKLVQLYTANPDNLQQIAEALDVSVRSARAKLVSLGIYKKKERVTKRKIKKNTLISRIAEIVGIEEELASSLEKATCYVLMKILEALEKLDEKKADE